MVDSDNDYTSEDSKKRSLEIDADNIFNKSKKLSRTPTKQQKDENKIDQLLKMMQNLTDQTQNLTSENGTSNIDDSLLTEGKVDLIFPNRSRCDSTSCSSSIDSSTSSSSSFSEDSDDSLKDPDYEDAELRHRNRRNASCSDE
ncbi:uncharacterized G-patch domain protein DDB_G0278987-like [Diabrotica virgifera virgifera]|uniref:Uncharacterized protein n=1 Tax=Diabrotica virgifera virgifera TaxID=50390 RepID=A0ABM5K0H0_DIAVI|nr:uncharacterized G-patch domain protein DDB_G0278987-like [Diabrotica virgifera virgifera]